MSDIPVKRLGVLTGGGDCPGLNSAIKWVVKSCEDYFLSKERNVRFESFGIRDGWAGLINARPEDGNDPSGNIFRYTENEVRTIDRHGGTMLGSSRTNPFPSKSKTSDESDIVLENIRKMNLDAVVAIGGEDTLGVAAKLTDKGAHMVGIPKTIDRDLGMTEYSLGFESAVQVITESIDKLRTTAGSHKRIFVVETMGRHAGHLALQGGIAGGAYVILIPEYNFEMDQVAKLLQRRKDRGVRYSIVVVAEGAKIKNAEITQNASLDAFGHVMLGGIGEWIGNQLKEKYGFDTRHTVLSHLQRGGSPCSFDRRIGRYFGCAAVELVQREMWGEMVSFQRSRITHVPLKEAVKELCTVDVEREYDIERYNCKRMVL